METDIQEIGLKQIRISKEELRNFSSRKPFFALLHIAMEWSLIVLAAYLTNLYFNVFFYILCVVWIGARQHALGVIMHDAAHGNLFASRKLNYVISDLFLAWPLLVATQTYWQGHSVHHRHTKNDKDPDWVAQKDIPIYQLPRTRWQFFTHFMKDMTGIGLFQLIQLFIYLGSRPKDPSIIVDKKQLYTYRALRISYYLIIFSVVHYLSAWKILLMFWFVPMITWFKWVVYLRSLGEHHGFDGTGPLGHTRTTIVSVFGKFFITPKNINFHMEHHIYPTVPFFRLPEVHKLLMENPEYRSKVKVNQGFWSVLNDAVHYQPQVLAGSAHEVPRGSDR